jgi:hypothetical protein
MRTDNRNGSRSPRTNSIRKTLQVTNIVIIVATLAPVLISTLYYNITLSQYERIIENVYYANSLSSRLKGEIYTTMWNVVAGKTRFGENTQYQLIDRIRGRLDELENNANSEDTAPESRSAPTPWRPWGLRGQIGGTIADGPPSQTTNEKILGEIGSVSELLYGRLQKFVAARRSSPYPKHRGYSAPWT